MCRGRDVPASEAQHPQSVRWVEGAGVQLRLSAPRSMEKTGWGRGGPAGQQAQQVRGDNKQGPVSRDRRGGKAQ